MQVIMDTTITKSTASIRIDSSLLKQLKEEAKEENRSLSSYLETLLFRMGYGVRREEETITPELKAKIEKAREDYKKGRGKVCKTVEESMAFFDSL